jgi:2-dehydro-3-deoxyphosphogluconate aldolase/(4S)-4-hydroxy-2-oxoglutarate aldolase
MQLALHEDIRDEIGRRGIIAVLEIEDVDDAAPVAQALVAGGVTAIELALRTPAAEPAIPLVAKAAPGLMIGIGTIIERGQAARVKAAAGAAFGVSPGLNPDIVREAASCGLPFAPGIATPSEIEQALALGCRTLKFFPAEPSGGLAYLKSIDAPYRHMGLAYIPLGGVNPKNLADYAALRSSIAGTPRSGIAGTPQILAIGGSWIAPRDLIRAKDWKEITARAREARAIWDAARG